MVHKQQYNGLSGRLVELQLSRRILDASWLPLQEEAAVSICFGRDVKCCRRPGGTFVGR